MFDLLFDPNAYDPSHFDPQTRRQLRAVIDWFNDDKAAPRTFDIGWQAFQPNSAEPAAGVDRWRRTVSDRQQ